MTVLTGAVLLVTSGCGSPAEPAGDVAARTRATLFLETYVRDGRVVRTDQGGDTVSEGQAYAMLLAVATGDRGRFDSVWRWSRDHLRDRDGLLAWRWRDGAVVDPSPAADADVDTAWALLAAGRRFGEGGYRDDGVRLAAAVLDHETVTVRGGRLLLAGPWARSTGTLNPSYLTAGTATALAAATGDGRWTGVAAATSRLDGALLTSGRLPPDWARLAGASPDPAAVTAVAAPGGAGAVRYSYDAARLPIRLAASCDAADRRRAALGADILATDPATAGAAVRSLDGTPRPGGAHPVALVAAAASDAAAGDRAGRDRLLAAADALDRAHPGYYGAAWAALGRVLLTTHLLDPCVP